MKRPIGMQFDTWNSFVSVNFILGDQTMSIDHWLAALACSLLLSSTASAQVLSGVMTVTGAEMH